MNDVATAIAVGLAFVLAMLVAYEIFFRKRAFAQPRAVCVTVSRRRPFFALFGFFWLVFAFFACGEAAQPSN